MKKTMKRLSTLVLALVLAMALAVPMFADCRITTIESTDIYLNVNRTSESIPPKGRGLILYRTNAPGIDQKFKIESASSDQYYGMIITFAGAPYLAVNRSTTDAGAILWSITDGLNDSIMTDVYIDEYYNGPSSFMLVRTSEVLAYPTGKTGDKLYFKHYLLLEDSLKSWGQSWKISRI